MFYFTSDEDPPLVTRKLDIDDNVIPAANSAIARVMFQLGTLNYDTAMTRHAERMLASVLSKIPEYGGGYSNWAQLLLHKTHPYYELAIMADSPSEARAQFFSDYHPNVLVLGSNSDQSELPLLELKFVSGEQMIYVCVDKSCNLPVSEMNAAKEQFKY